MKKAMTELMKWRSSRLATYAGSALILTVVLTSLLAIVAVLFVMISRVERMASSALSDSRDLDLAVGTLVERLSNELVLDVPGVAGQEYHDYPGPNDLWLAALEPNQAKMWPQISDVTGYLQFRGWPSRNIRITNSAVDPFKAVIPEYKPIVLATDGSLVEQLADADGDGVADSKWIELDNVTSSKARPIYAAVRVVCLGGMLNVNTGFKFDPYDPCAANIDGSSLMQINAMALAGPRGKPWSAADANALLLARANNGLGLNAYDLRLYEQNVIWRFGPPTGPYTPFDVSDELELRYRFLLNHSAIDTRLEAWGQEFRSGTIWTPVASGGQELDDWFKRAFDDGRLDPNYAYRHLATTCSIDRIINPAGPSLNNGRMVNVNTADKVLLRDAILLALRDANPPVAGADAIAAQIAVNIIDFRDPDSDVTFFDSNSASYNGFERPCVYLSEIACRIDRDSQGNIHRSFAVELFKPYFEDDDPRPGEWDLVIDGTAIPVNWSGTRRLHVIRIEDPQASLPVSFSDPEEPGAAGPNPFGYDPRAYPRTVQNATGYTLSAGSSIYLQRKVRGAGLVVDSYVVPGPNSVGNWFWPGAGARSIERDISRHKCIRRLWAGADKAAQPSLGRPNTFVHSDARQVQAHPANEPFRNIGELGMVLARSGYNVTQGSTQADLLIDLQNPLFANIFNYLTVIDPATHGYPVSETRVKGRVNVNTAPWFVLEQLPWMSVNPAVAKAVALFRDTIAHGFRTIGEVAHVPELGLYASDGKDQLGFPDMTYLRLLEIAGQPRDDAADDFEERDLIFHRISDLITVRSDAFAAYILVRIGPAGATRRVLAILDRSDVKSPSDKVKIVALQSVPDPR